MSDVERPGKDADRSWSAAFGSIVKSPGTYLIALSIVIGVVTVVVGTQDLDEGQEPNRLGTSLLQGITLVFGTVGSFVLGKDASAHAAREAVRPHAKSAFRRVTTLYKGLGRLKSAAEVEAQYLEGHASNPDRLLSVDFALASLSKVELMITEQIATADDALEDWRDLAPEEVAKIESAAKSRAGTEE